MDVQKILEIENAPEIKVESDQENQNGHCKSILKNIMPYDVIIKRPYHKIRGWIAQRQVSKLMHRRS